MVGTLVLLGAEAPPRPQTETHVVRRCQTLATDVHDRLAPNLRAYESLSKDIVERLAFMEKVGPLVHRLDRLRTGTIGSTLANSVPGGSLILGLWEKLKALSEKVATVKEELAPLKTTAGDLLALAERFEKSPSEAHLVGLLTSYRDNRAVFDRGATAFRDLDKLLETAGKALDKAKGALEGLSGLPWVGDDLAELGGKAEDLGRGLLAVKAIVVMTYGAIDRDKAELKRLDVALVEAHAHDAYDASERMEAAGRLGTALHGFRDVVVRWPDTQWSHLADRRVTELVAAIDGQETTIARLRREVLVLHATVSDLATKPALALGAPQPHEAARAPNAASNAAPPADVGVVRWTVGGMLAGALAMLLALKLRRPARASAPL